MQPPISRMLDLARLLVRNQEPGLLEDVLRMALAAAPSDPRIVVLLTKLLAGKGHHAEALAVGRAWVDRHGPVPDLLELLTRIGVSRGDAGADAAAVRTILVAPDRREAYQQLAALRDLAPDKRPVLQLLHWLSCWHAADDPQAVVLLHKAFQLGRAVFDGYAARLVASRPDLLWARYLRSLVGLGSGGAVGHAPEPLTGEPDPAFRSASLACVARLAGPATRMFASRDALFAHCLAGLAGSGLGRDGLYLEFGVAGGASARLIAKRIGHTLHAFDSFQGLPEAWEHEAAGSYSTGGTVPSVPANVQVHVGWFAETIPVFAARHAGPVAFLHVDCDLYASTVDVLAGLGDRLTDGSIVVFDEYFGYPGFENHELRAFEEFLARTGWQAAAIAVGPFTKQLAFQLYRAPAQPAKAASLGPAARR